MIDLGGDDVFGSAQLGRELTFVIEVGHVGPLGQTWMPHQFRAHGFTGEDGWAGSSSHRP